MEGDVIAAPGHGLRCFICDDPGTEMQKLSKVTQKGHSQMLSYSECVDDAALIRRLNEDWKNGDDPKLRYHLDCRTELYNRVKSISTATATANRQDEEDRRSGRMKRRRVFSGSSTSSAGSSKSKTPSVHLVYRDVCILCNEGINVGALAKYPDRARKLYRAPDNRYINRLKRSFMETAVSRGDAWGNEVAGRLSGIVDLVAEEALYHLRCRTLFEHPVENSKVGRPLDEEKQLLFENLCKWMDEEVEHGVTTLAEST
uniref:uncharacterized protein n=1 Tax=Myxine glutinosa TaxID=7769 RepID=UPI00358F5C61